MTRKIDFQKAAMEAILDFRVIFDLSHQDDSNQVSSQLAFRFWRRSKEQIFKLSTMVAILAIISEGY